MRRSLPPPDRFRRVSTLLLLGLCLFALPAFGQGPSPLPAAAPVAAESFEPKVPPRAIAYQRSHRVLSLSGLGWHLLGLGLLLRSGLSARLREAVYRALRRSPPDPPAPPPFRAVALFFAAYLLFLTLWGLPFGLAEFLIERRFGFSTQTFPRLLSDTILGYLFGLILIPVVWGGYRLYARCPKRWWLWLWALLTPLIFVQIVLQPVLIAPAYNTFTPLAPGSTRDRILALAQRSGITGARVFVTDTSSRTRHVNAYVTGLGPTTRIVLNDTALKSLPEDQLLAMMGHEMGHYVEGHIWVQFFGNVFGAGAFLWLVSCLLPWIAGRWGRRWGLREVSDLAALPLVMLVLSLFMVLQAPIAAAESRALERRADAFGLRITGLSVPMARLFVGFAERDYTDPDPPPLLQFWFGTHPPLRERIAFALNARQEQN